METSTIFALFLATLTLQLSHGSDVVQLTDENFDQLVAQGTWMVKVFAPWCSHCRKVRPVWEKLATMLKDEGINIGAIDGTKETLLVNRFETSGFPSFYHLKDGQCREYDGLRTVESFADFARSGYQSVKPMPFYQAPNGHLSRIMTAAKKVPLHVVDTYLWLHEEKKFSKLLILAMTLCIPAFIGIGLICVMDCIITRSQVRRTVVTRPHEE